VLDELRRAALVTSGVVDLTRQKAEQIVKDLVNSGYVRRDQTSGAVKELLKRSDENRKELTRFVRSELKNQIEGLGLATKRDLERLERKVARLEDARKAESKKKKTSAKKRTTASKVGEPTPPKDSSDGPADAGPGESGPENRPTDSQGG
jgi:polyhydroxyalkanoate synthesis regulator phasin